MLASAQVKACPKVFPRSPSFVPNQLIQYRVFTRLLTETFSSKKSNNSKGVTLMSSQLIILKSFSILLGISSDKYAFDNKAQISKGAVIAEVSEATQNPKISSQGVCLGQINCLFTISLSNRTSSLFSSSVPTHS
tara:strand:+ start:53 stop:457 length:405 start_codon:yes stop_codon:yes gene_type:complete